MRMAFGLIGVLVAVGVIVWIMIQITLPHTEAVLSARKKVEPEVQRISGHDENGAKATDSIKLDAESTGGKMTAVLVTSITPGGAMEKHFGLKRNDSIVQIGPLTMNEIHAADEAKDYLLDAYERNREIIVVRDEKRITLPVPAATPAPSSGTPAAAKKNKTSDDPLQRQLDAIPGIR